MQLSAYKGKVSKCFCTNSNPETPMDCKNCLCRGYVAECLNCLGMKQVKQGVIGASGEMWATCGICGGIGHFPINKPADWDILHPEEAVEAKTAEEIALDTPPAAGSVIPPMLPHAHVHNTPLGEPVGSVLAR